MADAKPLTLLDGESDDYNSSEDGDFDPTLQAVDLQEAEDSSSDSEDEDGVQQPPRKQIKTEQSTEPEDKLAKGGEDAGLEDDSGDEAILKSARERKRKRKPGDDHDDDGWLDENDEDGGEGGLIKTRAQRAREQKEKIPLSTTASATVDVDALWKSLNSPDPISAPPSHPKTSIETTTSTTIESRNGASQLSTRTTSVVTTKSHDGGSTTVSTASASTDLPLPFGTYDYGQGEAAEGLGRVVMASSGSSMAATEEGGMMTITRTYEFAGETVTEEKIVPVNSFEARTYLSSLKISPPSTSTSTSTTAAPTKKPLRRPTKKASLFDPGPGGTGVTKKATKLNTLEKSRMDWAGFVDKEGIGEDLDRQRKLGGDSYLERQDFLGRVGERMGQKKA